jgi:acylphosphatase
MQRKSYRFVVTGRVQGVFFRQSTRERAVQSGLDGWVRNRADGAVEGEVAGADAAALEAFRTWLQRGPPRAQVSDLRWTPLGRDEGPDAGDGFAIRD